LHLHEYQSKELLAKFQIATQPFRVASTTEEALDAATALKQSSQKYFPFSHNGDHGKVQEKPYEWVLKAQILAGGRGKGSFKENGLKGGVQLTTKFCS
jgi:succinyl-CoA synthetase beta subunit